MNRSHIEAALPVLKQNGVPYLIHAEIVADAEAQVTSHISSHLQHGHSQPIYTTVMLHIVHCQQGARCARLRNRLCVLQGDSMLDHTLHVTLEVAVRLQSHDHKACGENAVIATKYDIMCHV